MRVLIIGAGGHAQVVADALMHMQTQDVSMQPIGYLDDDPKLTGECFLGLPVMGTRAQLPEIAHDAVIIAIGDNQTRQYLFETLLKQGEHFVTVRHPNSIVAQDVHIGHGSLICAGVVVNPSSVIGADVILNTGCTIDHHNHIGDHAHVAPGVHLGGQVRIGSGTLIGIGATIMPLRSVGEWSIVGAGALVHTDLPHREVAIGVPAKVVREGREEI